ncbi:exodeoxyribonuclease 7 large subunit [Anaerotignum neopropionicum]|uniref:Exodeoxyribonuclease 7 large subunit n=1 Tax=Anaerotignum neopropionicum TaxID=36847 RepID=A0A136WEU9_9FIRM|nr:exodeoxyribonuclease VII large subunit [Anaerotignum neopropionicum]KXL53052.1 exodeoxyribonuclease 7 large subunit [Anaerotignum neopropionicum]
MIEPKVFSVGQINRYIKNLMENDFILSSLLVKGEISNFKAHSGGHFYFSLKDAVGAISCVMFKQDALCLPFLPENGMSVIIFGHVSLYEKTGQYQLYAEMMEPVGIGSLQIAFEQLKRKLEEEGLFDQDFKRDIPTHIETIAVITSPTGAAVRDIIQIAKRRDPRVEIAVFPALVQGERAADDIVRAIKLANEWGKADVIIIGRGGGSMEDLWPFNEEKVARAIFASEIPIISAVGHETDFTIADFVSDLRAPTPSAAAELATQPLQQRLEGVAQLEGRLQRNILAILEDAKRRLLYLKERPVLKRPLEQIRNTQLLLEGYELDIEKAFNRTILRYGQRVGVLDGRLYASSPLAVMKRGYVMALNENKKTIVSVKQVEIDEVLQLRLQDGHIRAKVLEKAVMADGEKEAEL